MPQEWIFVFIFQRCRANRSEAAPKDVQDLELLEVLAEEMNGRRNWMKCCISKEELQRAENLTAEIDSDIVEVYWGTLTLTWR